MIKRVLRFCLGVLIVLLGVAGAWSAVMYMRWPLWSIVPVLIGALVLIVLMGWAYRRWQGWRLRRELLGTTASAPSSKGLEEVFEQQWQAGVQVLRDGHLGTQRRTLYGLPWIIVLDVVPPTEQDELNILAVQKSRNPEPETGLSWCFLKAAVVLRFPVLTPMLQQTKTADYWRFFLKKLNKTRRREPLNGVVFNINTPWLEQASEAELHQLGESLRHQLDAINQIFNARISSWIVLSQSQGVEGLSLLTQYLGTEQVKHSFGFHEEQTQGSVASFIQRGFEHVLNRANDLCLWVGQIEPNSAQRLALPEQLQRHESDLRRILLPAFEASPYAINPLLRGIYWTATSEHGGITKSWFSEQLYDRVLPYQRHAWEAVDRLGPWRRLLRQAAALAWLGLCTGVFVLFLYAAKDVKAVIEQASARNVHQFSFSGGIESDLQGLNTWHDMIIQLTKSTRGVARILPFRHHLVNMEQQLKEDFVALYKREIRHDFMDGFILEQLPFVIKSGSALDVAAWAQYLVRRINLVQARIEGKDLKLLPLIGPEFSRLYAQVNPQVGLQTGVLLGQLYPDYLRWQQQKSDLQGELDSLKATLQQLNLGQRQVDWLLAWVDLQNDLVPITLADFWPVKSTLNGPHIAAGLTKAGTQAIAGFVQEVASATGEFDFWVERREKMNSLFVQTAYDAWYRFLVDFDQGRNYLDTESAWKSVLSLSFSPNDPYVKLLNTLHTIFAEVPAAQRPSWIGTVIELDQLIKTADVGLSPDGTWVDQARTVNELGHIGWGIVRDQFSVEKAITTVRDGMIAVEHLQAYEQQVQAAAEQMLAGQGNALQFAEHTWSYGYDPTITESPLHTAQQHFSNLRALLVKGDIREGAVWRIANGPLSFALEYAARSAACGLQTQWNTQVLSVVENVHSQLLAQDLLYGQNGSVETFMKGTLQAFVERQKSHYQPRKALGLSVPLNGEFFSYLNTVQAQQTGGVISKFEQEHKQRHYHLQLDALQQKEKELEQQEPANQRLQGVVSVEMRPPLVNPGAKRLPQRTTLLLQCAPQAQKLENYNFPTKQLFDWNESQCSEARIILQFPDWTIEKVYAGSSGFLDLLRDFRSGSKTLMASEFPESELSLQEAGITSISLHWILQGQDAVLSQAEQKQQHKDELKQLRQSIQTLRQQQAGPSLLEQPLIQVRDVVPEQITHQCWYPYAPIYSPVLDEAAATQMRELALVEFESDELLDPLVTALQPQDSQTASMTGAWLIHVGVFANPALAIEQLEALGITHGTRPVELKQGKRHLVYSPGYSNQEQAQEVADTIANALHLEPLVLNAR